MSAWWLRHVVSTSTENTEKHKHSCPATPPVARAQEHVHNACVFVQQLTEQRVAVTVINSSCEHNNEV